MFVAYCSSDAHMGDMEMTTGKFGVQQVRGGEGALIVIICLSQYRGRRMARQAVSSLVGKDRKGQLIGKIFQNVSNQNISGQEIIFGGTSAGGRGSMVLVDHLHELLDDTTMIYGLHDSGAYQGDNIIYSPCT